MEAQNLAKNSIFQGKERLVTEKRLSILKRAFECSEIQQNLYLRLLNIKCVKQASESDDLFKTVTKEYQELLRTLSDPKGEIFTLYLLHRHSDFLHFSASFLRKEIKELLEEYSCLLEGSSNALELKKGQNMMLLLLGHSLMIERRMGYHEKTTGIIQAMLEMNVLLNQPRDAYEPLWEDYSSPKIGEVDPNTGQTSDEFETMVLASCGINSTEFLFLKQCPDLPQLAIKEALFQDFFWSPVRASKDKV